ncbi:MAG: spore coat protein GerQ [Bacilli bacterium]|jgi:spore germination protein Q|nr:spore coat protein GerQ [Bacilli bacterium]
MGYFYIQHIFFTRGDKMNNNGNNVFPGMQTGFPGVPLYTGNGTATPNQQAVGDIELPMEQSYIENILRINRGKKVEVYMTFTDSTEWRDRVFSGIIEQAGRDHLILSDPSDGKWYLLQLIYLDYIKFDERINYSSEFLPHR